VAAKGSYTTIFDDDDDTTLPGCQAASPDMQVQLGGVLSTVESGYLSSHATSPNMLDDPSDSTSTCIGAQGVEVMFLDTIETGVYTSLIYQYGDDTGFVYAFDASVNIWQTDPDTGITSCVYTFIVADASQSDICYGRFWNTFQMNVTSVDPLEYTVTSVQSITTTPLVSIGSTSTQGFEGGNNRPTSGCS